VIYGLAALLILAGLIFLIAAGLSLLASPSERPQAPERYMTDQLWKDINEHLQHGTMDQIAQKTVTVSGLVCYHYRPFPASEEGRMALSRNGDPDTPDCVLVWLEEGEVQKPGTEAVLHGELAYEKGYIFLRHARIVEAIPPRERQEDEEK
jgi:hypothetical protein